MKFVVDTHTHTISSGHAYSTLDEIARTASEKGLQAVAITDHTAGMPGGAHAFYFANLRIVPRVMHGVRILRGAETNIIDYDGHIDLEQEFLEGLDVVIASLHPPCLAFAEESCITNTLIKAMENPNISIIGHPGDSRYPFDIEKVVQKAKETHTLLEVNVASLKPTSYRPGVRENVIKMLAFCKDYNVPIVLGSDAHIAMDVGEFKEALELLEEIHFPEGLIINRDVELLIAHISQKRLK